MEAKSPAAPMGSASRAGTFFEAVERPEKGPSDGPSRAILGIDPCVNGAIAVLNAGGDLLQVCEKSAEESERHALHWLAVTERGT
jgi:predicted RNase H-like nuclease (RuvC/YqgF family)